MSTLLLRSLGVMLVVSVKLVVNEAKGGARNHGMRNAVTPLRCGDDVCRWKPVNVDGEAISHEAVTYLKLVISCGTRHLNQAEEKMDACIILARSSLPSMQTMFVVGGIVAVICGIFYSRMSMS